MSNFSIRAFQSASVARGALLLGVLALAACSESPRQEHSAPAAADGLAELRARLATVPGATWEVAPETGVTREYELVAAPSRLSLLDGRTLDVWAYNDRVPGPTLRANVGDRLRVRLVNRLPQATSIHWHGLRLDNRMDGVPGVTQPPVEPGESFTYEFVLKDAGTFWFHPHILRPPFAPGRRPGARRWPRPRPLQGPVAPRHRPRRHGQRQVPGPPVRPGTRGRGGTMTSPWRRR